MGCFVYPAICGSPAARKGPIGEG
ncbi:Protein of unknown function [Bacillus mycoides]|nr:Protein of unknown function [Bacillus mycoides]SCM84991.1 Protein of unknown function [Bacillus mycoides]